MFGKDASAVMSTGLVSREGVWCTGVPRSSENAFPQNPTAALCLGPYGGPWWGRCLVSEVFL
jgi:hypothetical protein